MNKRTLIEGQHLLESHIKEAGLDKDKWESSFANFLPFYVQLRATFSPMSMMVVGYAVGSLLKSYALAGGKDFSSYFLAGIKAGEAIVENTNERIDLAEAKGKAH